MSNRHRLPYAALGGCLGVVLGIGIALGQSLNQGDVKGKETPAPTEQRQEAPSAPSVPPAIPAETGSESLYSPDCDSPKSLDEADLCEQRRMADAAYETVEWVRKQYRATIGEISALVVTIFVAGLAVGAAFRANRIARDSAEHQLRAYVMISDPIWTYPTDDSNFAVSLVWENTGQTPARRCMARASRGVFKDGLPDAFDYPDKASETKTETSSIGTSKTQKLTVGFDRSDVEATLRGEKSLFVWSWIEYDDMFIGTSRHRTEVCLRIGVKAGGQEIEPAVTGPFNGIDDGCHHQTKT